MKSKTRTLAMMLAVLCCIMAFSGFASAASPNGDGHYSSNEKGDNTPPDVIEQIQISTENVPTPNGSGGNPAITWDVNTVELGTAEEILSGFLATLGSSTPLTPSGNMTLVDDILQDESYFVQDEKVLKDKQFITVQSKNGNYFYIVIDRSGDSENVYFLNLVDEADLMALMDGKKEEIVVPECICKTRCEVGAINTNCPVCKSNMSDCTGKVKEKPIEKEPEQEVQAVPENTAPTKKNSVVLFVILLLLLVVAAGLGVNMFLSRKPKADTRGHSNLDDYDFGAEDEDTPEEHEAEITEEE